MAVQSFLPKEITEDNILTRLPAKSIARFRCVSKNWQRLFRNPRFIKNHLAHAIVTNKFNVLVTNNRDTENIEREEPYLFSIDHSAISSSSPTSSSFLGRAVNIDYPYMSRECMPSILGSSHGLVCIESYPTDICIWNPTTREYKPIPVPSSYSQPYSCLAHGFGYDCKNDDYKVLTIMSLRDTVVHETRIYSLASNSWKKLGAGPADISKSHNYKGIFCNGNLHWLTNGCIICFDISDETFSNVPIPYKNSNAIGNCFASELGVWEGKLCLLCKNFLDMENPNICTHIDVWTMTDNKWSKNLEITAHVTDMYYGSPIQTLQNGDILFEGGPKADERGIGLISYDPNLERARAHIHGFPGGSDVETYIGTLVALKSGTYVGQEKKKQQRRKRRRNRK